MNNRHGFTIEDKKLKCWVDFVLYDTVLLYNFYRYNVTFLCFLHVQYYTKKDNVIHILFF